MSKILDYGRKAPTESARRERRLKQFNYPNGNPKYRTYNILRGASETDIDWEIIKYSEDGLENEGPQTGAVNTEAVINALSWNI